MTSSSLIDLIVLALMTLFISTHLVAKPRDSDPQRMAMPVRTDPDHPVPFGYKCDWFAVKAVGF